MNKIEQSLVFNSIPNKRLSVKSSILQLLAIVLRHKIASPPNGLPIGTPFSVSIDDIALP